MGALPNYSLLALLLAVNSGCGLDDSEGYDYSYDYDYSPSSNYDDYLRSKSTSSSSTSSEHSGSQTSSAVLRGSVVSAFQITVDGQVFNDSEDFYTVESQRLPDKVAAAGYGGWAARFDAVLGFDDLAEGMAVYVAPAGHSDGYTGQGTVDAAAQFQVSLPEGANGSHFKVRAVKRVAVVVTKGGESRRFCYNFSAIEKSVEVTHSSQPVVLDEFRTQLTSYSCDSSLQSGGGIHLPAGAAPVTRTAAPEKIETVSIGELPESIVEKWGDPNSVDTKSRYSYYSRSYSYTKQWEYKSIAGHTLTTTCLLSFRDQRLTGYSGCPALRIEFHEAGAYIADTPRLRVARMDSKNTVLSSWGLPTRVSLDSDNATETWLYRDDRLTSGNCEINFLSGSVVDYSAGCRLGYLAHWTF